MEEYRGNLMKKLLILLVPFLMTSCLTAALLDSGYSNISVTYTVKNNSRDTEWAVIVYKDVLGNMEEEQYIRPGGIWEKTLNFKLSEYGSEHLSLAAHSLYGTFETTITVNDINESSSSGSRIKPSGKEYLSLTQAFIDREVIRKYKATTYNFNVNVNYKVANTSRGTEWTVIVYKDVIGNIEEELYMGPGEIWEKTLNFRLGEYGSEHLSLAAHSEYGTFDTTITVLDINQSVRSGSRIKDSGREYFSISQLFVDRDTIRKYK